MADKKPVILIVDDEEELRSNLKSFIEPRLDCDIKEASNGQEAIDYIKGNPCDVMILDIKMPSKSGIEVLDAAKDLPIATLVVTGWDSQQVFEECKDRNIADYIPKGGSLQVIFEKIIKQLKAKDLYTPKK